ncbi:hypothetical protein GCM10010345_46310 [Streptomyces canarius]|uniref:Uncharacterized protein n=1 Tax=Streptomyces canarius TaxID=285453 RepID=A0ABQ3CS57_9ACTN|nr:hypothetical protein GCM10010345_46310 [Streptomyces canarius]
MWWGNIVMGSAMRAATMPGHGGCFKDPEVVETSAVRNAQLGAIRRCLVRPAVRHRTRGQLLLQYGEQLGTEQRR